MQFVEYYYVILFWISLILTGIYVHMWHKHFSVNFSLIFAFIPRVNIGYVFKCQAGSAEAYLIATDLIYLGGCFLILFIMLNVFDMCKVEMSNWDKTICFFISTAVFLSVLTIGKYPVFYKSITVTPTADGLDVVKEYGPMHLVFHIMIVAYFGMSLAAFIYAYKKKKDVSRTLIILLFVPEAVAFAAFFGGRRITDIIEFTPLAYVFAQVMYLFIAHRICIYDISETAVDSLTESGDTGFISFDSKLRFLGANKTAIGIFESLADMTVDKPMSYYRDIYSVFNEKLEIYKAGGDDKFYYHKDDKDYLVDINDLYDGNFKKGYQFVITDDTKNQQHIKLINSYNDELEREVEKKTKDIKTANKSLIRGMAMLVESRDNSTGGHIIRTSDVVEILMAEIMKDAEFTTVHGIDETFRRNVVKASSLHDIGKIAVDDAILRKPGRFTAEEFEKMKVHASEGARVLHSILENSPDEKFKVIAENIAHYHHERMDGSGYPKGLKGDEIPIEARIMAVADVYDALVSKRVYKESMSFEKADSIMMESFGKHFDKDLEKFYLSARPAIEKYYTDLVDAAC